MNLVNRRVLIIHGPEFAGMSDVVTGHEDDRVEVLLDTRQIVYVRDTNVEEEPC